MSNLTENSAQCNPRIVAENFLGKKGAFTDHTEFFGKRLRTVSGKKERLHHLFSPQLATSLNKERPDIAAALVHYCIHTWQNSNRLGWFKCAFRSVRQLEAEMPYLKKSAIQAAIGRLEDAGVLEVDRKSHSLRYSIPKDVAKKYEYHKRTKSGRISILIDYATSHGIVESMVLGNFSWMMKNFKNCHATDDQGLKYYKLHPTELAKYLPRSAKAITSALKNLSGVLFAHPTLKWHYRYSPDMDINLPISDKEMPKPDSSIPKPDSSDVSNAVQSPLMLALRAFDDPVDSKVDCKADLNVVCKDNLQEEQFSPSASTASSSCSKSLQILKQAIENIPVTVNKLIALDKLVKQSKVAEITQIDSDRYDFGELPYDWIPRDVRGNPLDPDEYIDEAIRNWKWNWDRSGFTYTNQEIISLRNLLTENRYFTPDDMDEFIGTLDCNAGIILEAISASNKRRFDPQHFHSKVKTLGGFLRYLPQLIFEEYGVVGVEGGEVYFDAPNGLPDIFARLLDYLQIEAPGTELVSFECNPCAEVKLSRLFQKQSDQFEQDDLFKRCVHPGTMHLKS